MTQDEIIRMARELVTRHGSRMCDEDGETHGEELYCVGVEDIAEIIKQVAAHEREKFLNKLDGVTEKVIYETVKEAVLAEREACAKVCEEGINNATDWDSSYWDQCCENRAAAIRERGNK